MLSTGTVICLESGLILNEMKNDEAVLIGPMWPHGERTGNMQLLAANAIKAMHYWGKQCTIKQCTENNVLLYVHCFAFEDQPDLKQHPT